MTPYLHRNTTNSSTASLSSSDHNTNKQLLKYYKAILQIIYIVIAILAVLVLLIFSKVYIEARIRKALESIPPSGFTTSRKTIERAYEDYTKSRKSLHESKASKINSLVNDYMEVRTKSNRRRRDSVDSESSSSINEQGKISWREEISESLSREIRHNENSDRQLDSIICILNKE